MKHLMSFSKISMIIFCISFCIACNQLTHDATETVLIYGTIESPEGEIPAGSVITITLTDSMNNDAPSVIKKQYMLTVTDSKQSLPFQIVINPEILALTKSPGISARVEKDNKLLLTSHNIVPLAKNPPVEKISIVLQ